MGIEEVVIIPLIAGIVEAFKVGIGVEERYLPLLSLVIGVLVNVVYALVTGGNLAQEAFIGLVCGLSASGLYDVGKKTVGGK